jgi:S1-C subfamily serine protease
MKPSIRQALIAVVAALAGGGAAVAIGAATTSSSVTTVQAAAPLPAANVSQTATGISPAAIYRNDAPGVVLITATSTRKTADPLDPLAPPQTEHPVSIGSGFVADAQGHIYTHAHVVLGATSVKVLFRDHASYPAKVLGTPDKATDVAVLQVQGAPASELHPLPIGSVNSVHVGDPVVAIGNPLNEQSTITSGIVSAINRTIDSLEPGQQIYNAIQTDAAINHGNSGGPLIDRFGRVIGITSQIETGNSDPNAGNIGIGFAIPIDKVSEIARDLITKGHADHTYLGIKGTEITPDLEQAINLPVGYGVLVSYVVPGSPADMAGIQGGSTTATIGGQTLTLGGDIITSINGRKITSFANLAESIASKSAGDRVTLGILHDGQARNLSVTLANTPS